MFEQVFIMPMNKKSHHIQIMPEISSDVEVKLWWHKPYILFITQ